MRRRPKKQQDLIGTNLRKTATDEEILESITSECWKTVNKRSSSFWYFSVNIFGLADQTLRNIELEFILPFYFIFRFLLSFEPLLLRLGLIVVLQKLAK